MLNNKVRKKVKESRRGKRAICLRTCEEEEEEEHVLPAAEQTSSQLSCNLKVDIGLICAWLCECATVRLWRGKGKERRGGSVALVLL